MKVAKLELTRSLRRECTDLYKERHLKGGKEDEGEKPLSKPVKFASRMQFMRHIYKGHMA